MLFLTTRNLTRWIIIIISFIIISLILWNTYIFFQRFKAEERTKMKNWTFAFNEYYTNLLDENAPINKVAEQIVTDTTIQSPMLLVSKDFQVVSSRNINEAKLSDSTYVHFLTKKYASENQPIPVKYKNSTLFYGNSAVLNKLKYYPLALILIIVLFAAVVYFFYRSSKTAVENKLWSGMAKETAHQIGTPLSSLIGWVEILKTETINPEYITEIEKDIFRLQTITERFSKVGSVPVLEKKDIVAETKSAIRYIQTRSSKLISFRLDVPENPIYVNLNTPLYSWTIENLVKNGIDAMKGKGILTIAIKEQPTTVKIKITDTGKGISKSHYKSIFEPGYTTKKRGWGLGLSLAKRIIEEFHNGEIKVKESEKDKGTTFQIKLKKIT